MILSLFKLFRLPNLLIVALTQYSLQYLVIRPAFQSANLQPDLDFFHFTLLVIDTILIAMGGYVVNDLFDVDIDKINKSDQMVVDRVISKRSGWMLYGWIGIMGLLIAIYLANYVNNMGLVTLYPTAVLLLFLYSYKLKKTVLLGNIVVALFCAFVAGIVWFAERNGMVRLFEADVTIGLEITLLLGAYLVFAYLSTMIRELIKDMEDIKGDQQQGCKTFPIVFGIKPTVRLTILIAIVLLIALGWWTFQMAVEARWLQVGFLFIFITLPIIYLLAKLPQSNSTQHFNRLSSLAKYIMLSGLLYLFIH